MRFDARPIWKGEDVFVIGGGPSLKTFDWTRLVGRRTIGCNSAYLLGQAVCQLCIFGDKGFWNNFQKALLKYIKSGGVVISTAPGIDHPEIFTMPRKPAGLGRDVLGWNGNTGSLALNLAMIMGARRVFLLGFDMALSAGNPNWHEQVIDKPNENVYQRFISGFDSIVDDWDRLFPEVGVVNLNPDSKLTLFQKAKWEDFFPEPVEAMNGTYNG